MEQHPWPTVDVWVWWAVAGEDEELWVCLESTPLARRMSATRLVVEVPRNANKLEHGLLTARRAALPDVTRPQLPLWVWYEEGDGEHTEVWVASERQGGRTSLHVDLPFVGEELDNIRSAYEQGLLRLTGKRTVEEALVSLREARIADSRKAKRVVGHRSKQGLPERHAREIGAKKPVGPRKVVKLPTVRGARARPFGNLAPNHVHVVRGGAPGLGRHR